MMTDFTSGVEAGDLIYYYPAVSANTPAPYTQVTLAIVFRRCTAAENTAILASLPWATPIPADTGPYLLVSPISLGGLSLDLNPPATTGAPAVVSAGAVIGVIKASVNRDAIAALYPVAS